MNGNRERVAVTGLGVVSPLALGASRTFARLLAGEHGIGPLRRFDAQGVRARIAAEVTGFEVGSAERAGLASRTDALALAAAREALGNAGPRLDIESLGIVLGGTAGAMLETEEELVELGANAPPRRALKLVESPLSSTVVVLERALGALGCATTVCSACSSGAVAVAVGADWVLSGRASAVLAGGADALCRMTFMGFNALGALDTEPCRPFDVTRRGLTLGEGAAFLLLESESSARARGAPVLAWLTGWAVGAEAHHATHPEPSGTRAASLMSAALTRAGLSPADIDYVNAHGTGTVQNDDMEAEALRRTFGDGVARVKVSSSKAQLGHTLGAAGALEAAVTVLALEAGAAPPTVGLSQPAAPDLNHVIGGAARGPLRAALSNSFGFGGLDAVLLFEAKDREARGSTRAPVSLVVTSVGKPTSDDLSALDPERSRRFDRLAASATQAAVSALRAAHLGPMGVGFVVANAYGNVERSLQFLDRLLFQGPRHTPPAEFPHLVHSAIAGNASIYLGLSGPVFSVCEGELGAEVALAAATAVLELGMADAVLAGAIEVTDPVVRALRPSSLGRARGEGGAILLVETAQSAGARGVRPRARLLHHGEERGASRSARSLPSPSDTARARVILTSDDDALVERLAGTAWEAVPRAALDSDSGGHEAQGALALARALELFDDQAIDEVLVVAGNAGRRFFTSLGRSERSP